MKYHYSLPLINSREIQTRMGGQGGESAAACGAYKVAWLCLVRPPHESKCAAGFFSSDPPPPNQQTGIKQGQLNSRT